MTQVETATSHASLRTVLRDNWVFVVLLVVAALLRAVVAFTYRPVFFFTGDSVVYLDNSAHLVPGEARPILYAVFLRLVLFGHQLIAVPVLQHLMGLASAVVTYALLRHLAVEKWLCVLGTLFVLFDPLQLILEQNLLSESLFQLLLVVSFATLVWTKRPAFWQCAVVGAGLAAATVTRNVGLILIVPALGYALARRVGWRRLVTIAVSFLIPILAYAGWFDTTNGSFALQSYDGRFLYGRVAPFASCEGLHLDRTERLLCPSNRNRSEWPTWYVFGPPSPLIHAPLATDPTTNKITQSFALTVIEHQPLRYLSAVSKDFFSFFKPTRTTGPDADPVAVDFIFRSHTLTAYASPTITAWIRRADDSNSAHAVVVKPTASALIFWQRWFYFPGPLFALCVLLGFYAIVGKTKRGVRRLGAEGVLYSTTAVLLLLVPVATVVFDYRFLVPPLPLLGTAGALGASVLCDRIGRRRRRNGSGPVVDPEATETDDAPLAHSVVP